MSNEDIYNVPEELRVQPRWLVWRYEHTDKGTPTKVPYQAKLAMRASSTNPTTWCDFDTALKSQFPHDGLGFVVEPPLLGIDVDDAIDPATGSLLTWQGAPVQPSDFASLATYMEITPSGTGFRVWCRLTEPLPPGRRATDFGKRPGAVKAQGVEFYGEKRYFCMTGRMLPSSKATIEDCTEQVHELYRRTFQRSSQTEEIRSTLATGLEHSQNEIEHMALNVVENRVGPRHKVILGVVGWLASEGWRREDIGAVVRHLCAAFHEEDAAFDVPERLSKAETIIKTSFSRLEAGQPVAGRKYLESLLAPSALASITESKAVDVLSAATVLNLIGSQPPESFAAQEIKYLVEPEIPRGALALITGKPGSGKSTLVLKWCKEMAEAGNEVLYLDRDNPLFIAQERIERFGGRTFQGMRYWGLWNKDASGEPLEPPYPTDSVLQQVVKAMKNPVVVFDTFAAFSRCDENDNTAVGAMLKPLRALTSLGATVLLIHHTGKDPSSDYRGASAMEGAVDAALKIVSTIVDGHITSIEVQTFKTRIGDGKPIHYRMTNGIPERITATHTDMLYDLLSRNPGLTKEKFEDLARKEHFRRNTIRRFVDEGLVSGHLQYESRKLSVKRKPTKGPKRASVDEMLEMTVEAATG